MVTILAFLTTRLNKYCSIGINEKSDSNGPVSCKVEINLVFLDKMRGREPLGLFP